MPIRDLGRSLIHLGLIAAVLHLYAIEDNALDTISAVAIGGFAVHWLAPVRHRLTLFCLLSVIGLGLVAGPLTAASVLGCGTLLVGLCHLPLGYWSRVAAVLGAALVLAAMRLGWMPAPWPDSAWPLLGSIFMYRLAVYLYDLRHETQQSLPATAAYFLLLPNLAMPLFPIVDYRTMRRTYDPDSAASARVGIQWMSRGVVQLLLYRLVYRHAVLAPAEIDSTVDLIRYLAANFALYLRVSGLFHFAIGMLRLFGFQLPPTHNDYFLASGVNDFWRRINIYWKDFMEKLFFYPAFFRLKRSGQRRALVLATLWVVAATWALHSYQWFWIDGRFPVVPQDIAFWGILGVMMVASSLWEQAHPSRRRRTAASLRDDAGRALRIVATFTGISILWSLWTCESFAEWGSMWRVVPQTGAVEAARLVAIFLAATAGVLLWLRRIGDSSRTTGTTSATRAVPARVDSMTPVLAVLCLMALSPLTEIAGPSVAVGLRDFRSSELNRNDQARQVRGYYEDILNRNRLDSPLFAAAAGKPKDWDGHTKRGTRELVGYQWIPNASGMVRGAPMTINSVGLRDREYTKEKPPGVYRIALLGASIDAGEGVADDETYEAIVERRLNAANPGSPVELINFSCSACSALHQRHVIETQVLDYEPDAIFFAAHNGEVERAVGSVAERVHWEAPIPYPWLSQWISELGLNASLDESEMRRRLQPRGRELLDRLYADIVDICVQHGIQPVWVYVPFVDTSPGIGPELRKQVRKAGFVDIELGDVFAGEPKGSLKTAPWDIHPNARAHRLISERLYDVLQRDQSWRQRPDDNGRSRGQTMPPS